MMKLVVTCLKRVFEGGLIPSRSIDEVGDGCDFEFWVSFGVKQKISLCPVENTENSEYCTGEECNSVESGGSWMHSLLECYVWIYYKPCYLITLSLNYAHRRSEGLRGVGQSWRGYHLPYQGGYRCTCRPHGWRQQRRCRAHGQQDTKHAFMVEGR